MTGSAHMAGTLGIGRVVRFLRTAAAAAAETARAGSTAAVIQVATLAATAAGMAAVESAPGAGVGGTESLSCVPTVITPHGRLRREGPGEARARSSPVLERVAPVDRA
jgi:hypothetical protein